MGLEDMASQAKDLLDGAPAVKDAMEGAVDQGKAAVEERTPDQVDSMVENAAQAIKDHL